MRYLLVAVFWLGAAGAAEAAGDARLGRGIAIEACSACHKVSAGQTRPAPVLDPDEGVNIAAPDFTVIARKYARRPKALRRYIQVFAIPCANSSGMAKTWMRSSPSSRPWRASNPD